MRSRTLGLSYRQYFWSSYSDWILLIVCAYSVSYSSSRGCAEIQSSNQFSAEFQQPSEWKLQRKTTATDMKSMPKIAFHVMLSLCLSSTFSFMCPNFETLLLAKNSVQVMLCVDLLYIMGSMVLWPYKYIITNIMSSNNLYETLVEMARMENIELSETQTSRQSESETLSEFAKKMKLIKSQLEFIRRTNGKILKMKEKLSSAVTSDKQSALIKQTNDLCDSNYDMIVQVRNELQTLTEIVKKAQQQFPDEPETHAQIYQKQYMIQEVNTMIADTQKVQKLIERYSINSSLNRIKALDPGLTDQEAYNLAQKKDGFEQLVMQKTLGKASLKLKYRLEDIIEKNNQINKLEQAVTQNLRLMEEIAFLVKQQGEMIDNIHDNILNAKDYIEKAEQVLHKEKKQHKKSRKKLCCIILVAIVILALIVVPIVLTVVNKNKSKPATTTSARNLHSS